MQSRASGQSAAAFPANLIRLFFPLLAKEEKESRPNPGDFKEKTADGSDQAALISKAPCRLESHATSAERLQEGGRGEENAAEATTTDWVKSEI